MEYLKKLLSVVNKFAKTFALISSLPGILMVIIFLVSTNSPLPPIDASFGATITVFMLYIFIYLILCFSASLFPAFTTPARSDIAKRAYSFMSNPIYKYGKKKKFPIFLYRIRTYSLLYLPFISISIIFFWMFLAGGDPSGRDIFLLFSCITLTSACISAWTIYSDVKKVTTLENGEFFNFFMSILFSNLISIFWFFVFYIMVEEILKDSFKDTSDNIRDIMFFSIVMISHCVLCSSAPSFRSLSLTSVSLGYFLIMLSPNLNVSTSFILKIMGAGGSSAVSIYIKEPSESGRVRIVKTNGCLMFSTASFVVIKTSRSGDFKEEYCDIQVGKFYSTNGGAPSSINSIFSRSDIYKISNVE